jgi:hypothetical protein
LRPRKSLSGCSSFTPQWLIAAGGCETGEDRPQPSDGL